MRSPSIYSEEASGSPGTAKGPTGKMARVRSFLAMSLRSKKYQRSSSVPPQCSQFSVSLSEQALSLIQEGSLSIGRSLNEHKSGEVPPFLQSLCSHLLTVGADIDTLASEDWSRKHIRAIIFDGMTLNTLLQECPVGVSAEAFLATNLFRLYLAEIPRPLISRNLLPLLFDTRKDIFNSPLSTETESEEQAAILCLLRKNLSEFEFRVLDYIVSFMHQIKIRYDVRYASNLGNVLGREICRLQSDDRDYCRIGQFLIENYEGIFQNDAVDEDYSSDSSSRTTDAFTPDDRTQDDTSSSSDTDEFRSTPVSPLKEFPERNIEPNAGHHLSLDLYGSDAQDPFTQSLKKTEAITLNTGDTKITQPVSSPGRLKRKEPSDQIQFSTKSLRSSRLEVEEVVNRRKPFRKEPIVIRSITELLSTPDDTSRDEGIKASNSTDLNISQEESSANSDESSEESDTARDADGSDTDGGDDPCPHEERRSSERSFPGIHKSFDNKKPRRKSKRRHSKEDLMTRVQSSEDDEKGDSSPDDHTHLPQSSLFRDLLTRDEPATVDRASWGYKNSHSENFHRTAPRFSRYDEEGSGIEKKNWLDNSNNSQSKGNQAMKSITKSISSLKKKIKRFEEEFEINYGYRPSHSDKMKDGDVKKLVSELHKLRKEMKQMKDDMATMLPKPFRLDAPPPPPLKPDTLDTIRHVEETLQAKRYDAHRPSEINHMTEDQIQDEKTDIQRALLYYESIHGRPRNKEDRDIARPLYDRYRVVKRTIVRTTSRTKENMELPPIIEHVQMDFTLASPQHRGSLQGEEGIREHQEILLNASINPDPHPNLSPTPIRPTVNIGDLHALPIHELRERKKEARDDKRRLRKVLRDFEEKFEEETGRKVQKEDRGGMERNYSDYKHVKAKLRLLEALISKHESLK